MKKEVGKETVFKISARGLTLYQIAMLKNSLKEAGLTIFSSELRKSKESDRSGKKWFKKLELSY